MNRNSYYSMTQTGNSATLNIYGDITSCDWFGEGVSVDKLSKQLAAMGDVSDISVYINSYGGEVAEGLAIYNALKRHKAKVTTYCDGFAASIASVIFMAGDERIMNDSSLLMIHNAWSIVEGNAETLRKQADDLEKITQASIVAYKAHSTLSEEEIVALMDAESWILPEEALQYGFATAIEETKQSKASQNARKSLFEMVKMHRAEEAEDEDEDKEDAPEDEPEKPETEDDSSKDEQPEDKPDDDEQEAEDNPADDEEEKPDDEDDDTPDEAAQKWSGFFNALLKM